MPITNESTVTRRERKRLTTPPVGTPFDPWQRMFTAYDSGTVFEYGDFNPFDVDTMLRRDGKARSVELLLTLPLRSAPWKIEADKGDTGQAELVERNLGPLLPKLIDQMTTAIAYRKAFFETTWKLDGGRTVYDRIDWRPATACEAGFDPDTGQPKGFRQRVVPLWGGRPRKVKESQPGYVPIRPERAFIYTHGAFRNPIHGISDLDCTYWAFETRQKILFLLFQFLENQSLPKTVVYGQSDTEVEDLVDDFAELKASGVVGVRRNAPDAKVWEVLESSGQGAAQFLDAIRYLESQMTASVLAAFTDLPTAAANGAGSYALSADQSEFFLASRQAVADEIADAIRCDVIGPLVRYNWGPDAPLPKLTIGPLASNDKQRSLDLLRAIASAPQVNMPREVIDLLLISVSTHLGLDETKVREACEVDEKRRAEKEAEQAKLAAQQARMGPAPAVPGQRPAPARPGQPPARPAPKLAKPATKLSRTVDLAYELVNRVEAGESPERALRAVLAA